jgi:hemolysin D
MGVAQGLLHHMEVLSAAWKDQRAREKEGGSRAKSRRDELNFLPAVLEVTETPAPPLSRAVALTIMAFFVITIGWAMVGEMDIIATAQGKIIPSQRVKTIQPMEVAVVRAIHVRDGSRVKAGDVLVELDPTGSEADRARLSQDLISARVELARLTALLSDDAQASFAPPVEAGQSLIAQQRAFMLSQLRQHRAERAALQSEINRRRAEAETISAEINRLTRKFSKVSERVEGSRTLYEKGILAKLKFAELEEELFDVEGSLLVERKRLAETEASLASAKAQARQTEAEWRRDLHAQMTDAASREQGLTQELIKAAERNRLQTLRAPVDGTVQQLAVHTIGGVVTEAQPLMQIVPADAEIEVEALVLNKDIGFVHATQEAELKIESFPFTKYGTIVGKVRHVYTDAIEDERSGLAYPARVSMAETTMLVGSKKIPLTPGMSVTVEIKTGKRRIIDYILAPLQEYQDESLREQ